MEHCFAAAHSIFSIPPLASWGWCSYTSKWKKMKVKKRNHSRNGDKNRHTSIRARWRRLREFQALTIEA